YGFHWKETPVIRTLAGGVVHNLTYTTSVYSDLGQRRAVQGPCSAGLVGYAGFGDPIGRGGALFSVLAIELGALVGSIVGDEPCAVDPLTGPPGIGFTPITFQKPVFENGVLRFGPGGVPEPATWAMLIIGFGGIGATLRRRRNLGAHA
uniref:PEPxxWA-CTERM sorting domain-containing protein n=1 Tax=uncultured Phenylobacterium sp. TaxID=349273 RepID=UPI0025D589F4